MIVDVTGTLDEALERLHHTGPEFDGWLSNHGPMAVEAMVRGGRSAVVHRWLDDYSRRLDELPAARAPIGADWTAALGDERRIGDWIGYFTGELDGRPWREVLATWWPRLLPGIAAGATHGVIRVGHAVRVLLAEPVAASAGEPRVVELAHALGYWAARWQPVPGVTAPAGVRTAGQAMAGVPRIADQSGGIRDRLGQLTDVADWPGALAALRAPVAAAEVPGLLADVVDAAVLRYRTHGHGSGVMLVHAATAPSAVSRVLPALPTRLWGMSFGAAWAASAALLAVYGPAEAAAEGELPVASGGMADVFDAAVAHGDEHVIKFADTAADTFARTGDPAVLSAAVRATQLIPSVG